MECKARHWAIQDLGSYIPTSHLRCPIYLPLNNGSGDDKKRHRGADVALWNISMVSDTGNEYHVLMWSVSGTKPALSQLLNIVQNTSLRAIFDVFSAFILNYIFFFIYFQSLTLCSDSLRSDEILEAMKKKHFLMRNLRFGRQVHPSVYCFVHMHTPNPQI